MSQVNITLKEFIDANQAIIGFDSESQCAYDLINRARIIAYPIGDWVGTMVYRPVQLTECYFFLPFDLEVIRQAKSRCGNSLSINSIISREEFDRCDESILTRIDRRVHLPFELTHCDPLCFYAVNKQDEKSIVRVIYLDWAGTMRDEEIELGHTPSGAIRLQNIPKTILRIEKGSTHGYVIATNGVNTAYLDPRDKNPMFTVYRIADVCKPLSCIIIYAKKKYIPYNLNDESEVLDINPEAISTLIIGLKAKDARGDNWLNQYTGTVELAKNFLNTELKNEQGTMLGISPVNFTTQFTENLNQDY